MSKSKIFLWLGMIALIATGLVHGLDAPDCFEEAAYKGWLFYANALGCLVAAFGIFRNQKWGWSLGAVIAACSIAAYVASRTVGLPGIPAEPDEWLEPLGVVAVLSEVLFLVVYTLRKSAK